MANIESVMVNPAGEAKKRLSMHIYVLPNLITTGNIFFGFYSIIQAIKGEYLYSAYAIVIASVFDLLDGRLARLTRSTSKFGAEYDSLCDLISFGMAPAVLLHQWALSPFGRAGWLACFLYLTCGALRLARFNVQANILEKAYFQGLPIPMAAGIVASSVLAFKDRNWEASASPWLLAMTCLLALVMVSTFRYRSFKDFDLKHRMPFRYLMLGVGVIIAVALNPEVNLFFLFLIYAVLGAIFGILRIGKNRREKANAFVARQSAAQSSLVAGPESDLVEDEDGEEPEPEDEENGKAP
jgi:CDP-diacylglycerol---serine O-phosphatidyltransferase